MSLNGKKNSNVKRIVFRVMSMLALIAICFVTTVIDAKADSEVEDNGDRTKATVIPVNTSMTGSTAWGDEDFYRINLTEPGTISYTFKHELLNDAMFIIWIEKLNWDMMTYDTILGSWEEDFTSESFDVPEGIYFINIQGTNTTPSEYSITVNYTKENEDTTDNTDDSIQIDKERIDEYVRKLEAEINPGPDSVNMFRLYNENNGEHFYTSSTKEAKSLINGGWKYEGVAWVAPKESSIPVYRLYNYNSGEHHYTTSMREAKKLYTTASGNNTEEDIKGQGWDFEGIGWYSAEEGSALYRLYNPNATGDKEPGSHHYTQSKKERDSLVAIGWRDEGIGWYGY